MPLSQLGKNTSTIEVANISAHGIWLLVGEKEYFLPYDKFPWFKDAKVGDILDVTLSRGFHLYWPKLDVDLELATLENSDQFPLVDTQVGTPVDDERTTTSCRRVFMVIGLVVYMVLALFVAFFHCSRIAPAPHIHPMTAILLGPFGLMPFHGVTFAKFTLSVGLGVGPLFIVVLTNNPRWRVLAAAASLVAWIVSAALVIGWSTR